jgi:TolA-binding protein
MSTKSELKENILATKLESLIKWGMEYRSAVMTVLGIIIIGALIGSVFVLRQKEQNEKTVTRLAQAQAFVGQRRFLEAESILSELHATRPPAPTADLVSYYLGLSLLEQKKYEESKKYFQEIIDRSGTSALKPLAISSLAFSFEELKDYSSAVVLYQKFMSEFSDHFMAPRIQLGGDLL